MHQTTAATTNAATNATEARARGGDRRAGAARRRPAKQRALPLAVLALAALLLASVMLPSGASASPARPRGAPGLSSESGLSGGPGLSAGPSPSTTIGHARPDGLVARPAAQDPGPPMAPRAGRLEPLAGGDLDRLLSAPPAAGASCDVNFEDPADLAYITGYAKDTFAVWPFVYHLCGLTHVRVWPTNLDHFHVTYADPAVVPCQNADNPHGTLFLEMARDAQECEPIDPSTEPRGFAHSMFASDIIKVELAGSDSPFRIDRVRILPKVVHGGHGEHGTQEVTVRTCFKLDGAWEAAGPPPAGTSPGQFCWNLGSGLWDLSAYTAGSVELTFTGTDDGAPNFAFDDIRLTF